MAVDDFPPLQGVRYFVDVLLLNQKDFRRIQFSETDALLPVHDSGDSLRVQNGAGGFQARGRGDAGGNFNQEAIGQIGGALQHGADAVFPRHIRNFHQIGAERRGTLWHDHTGQRFRREHGGFKVHVAVDEAGDGILPASVDDGPGFQPHIRVDGDNALPLNMDAGGINFAGKGVDQLHIFQA